MSRSRRVVDAIIRAEVFDVVITGGEPLGVIEIIAPEIARLRDAGISLSLNSNLTLLSPQRVQLLKELGINQILTSIMSACSETHDYLANLDGALVKAVEGIRLALSSGLSVSANMVLMKPNLEDIGITAELVENLGIRHFFVTRVSSPAREEQRHELCISRQEFISALTQELSVLQRFSKTGSLVVYPDCYVEGNTQLRQMFGGKTCSAGRTSMTIGFDGQTRPCPQLPQVYGDVDQLQSSWHSMSMYRDTTLLPSACNQCPAATSCLGGCKYEGYVATGELTGIDPQCDPASYVPPISQSSNTAIPDLKCSYAFQNFKWRSEDFGAVLLVGKNSWLPVDHVLYQFFVQQGSREFAPSQLADVLQVSLSEISLTIRILLDMKILEERR